MGLGESPESVGIPRDSYRPRVGKQRTWGGSQMNTASMSPDSLHRLARRCKAQLARVVVIPATGNRSHALAMATLDVQPFQQRLCFLRRYSAQLYSGQSRVNQLLVFGLRMAPYRNAQHKATKSHDDTGVNQKADCRVPANL